MFPKIHGGKKRNEKKRGESIGWTTTRLGGEGKKYLSGPPFPFLLSLFLFLSMRGKDRVTARADITHLNGFC